MASKVEVPMEGVGGDKPPVRGRGGFRQNDLRTIPSNIVNVRATNPADVRPCDLMANYVAITPMANRLVHMYRIDYEPAVESMKLMRFLFKTAAEKHFTKVPIFDGMHECRSGQQLPNATTETEVADAQDKNKMYKVKIVHTGTSSFGPENLRIYNMHMKQFLRKMGYYSPQVGLYVHQNHCVPVGQEIMMLGGFRTAANQHDGGKMLMNLEGAHKLVQKKNVLQYIGELQQRGGANFKAALNAELIGKAVVTSYDQKCYRIEEVNFDMNPTSKFDRNGTPTTFIQYYQSAHHKTIQDQKQPLLKAVPNNQRKRDDEPQREILLVPEFCNIAGLTGFQRNDNRLKMDLIRASQIPPVDRVKHMREFLSRFHQNEEVKQQLASWGYNYSAEPVRLRAHTNPPTGFADGRVMRAKTAVPSWPKANMENADIRIQALAVAPLLRKVAVITTKFDMNEKGRILGALKQGMDSVGLAVAGSPHAIDVPQGDSARHYIEALRKVPQDTDIAIVIMNKQNKERYDAIKKAASVEMGLITQVITAKLMTDDRKAKSASQKIAIQMAAKIGGEPWFVDIPLKAAMVCGYDTYHDTAQRGRSYGAFVASLNEKFSRWWSKADAHDRIEEVSAQVSTNIKEAIKHYKKFNNNALPTRVIIYRDGVGEGQLAHVFDVEVKTIQAALAAISKEIKLTVIIVNKRIGARFYARATSQAPNRPEFENPPPGTVIDHTVTRQERYDFYLISQHTRQGTVTPTYYNIIHDQSGLSPDIHQKLAFKLCSLYYNWSGTVRVPAPCQYAHKLALLCGEHLHGQPNGSMDDKLHFL